MKRTDRTSRQWAALTAVAVFATFGAAIVVWIVLTSIADNVVIEAGLGISEEATAWLGLIPMAVIAGLVVALVARVRGRWLVLPATLASLLSALVLGVFQLADLGRNDLETVAGEPPDVITAPGWALWAAVVVGSLVGVAVADSLERPTRKDDRARFPVNA